MTDVTVIIAMVVVATTGIIGETISTKGATAVSVLLDRQRKAIAKDIIFSWPA